MGRHGQWFLVIGAKIDGDDNYDIDAVVLIAPTPSTAREWAEKQFAWYEMYPLHEKIVEL